MFAVQGIYDDGIVSIEEPIPINNRYNVIVTFIKPAEIREEKSDIEKKMSALNRITGVLSENALSLESARKARLSRQ